MHAIILGLIQGLTEFLPVSSSAHLILIPKLLHWPDQGLAFDVATHVGTLCAVLFYFRHELKLMIRDWCKSLTTLKLNKDSRLAWDIGFATIPVGLAALIFHDYIANGLRSTSVIAITTIAFGILLGIASRFATQKRDEYKLTWRDVAIIGVAQAIALIPGVSRSGITLTAGLFVGLERTAAARFSFLMSIPVIILAGTLEAHKVMHSVEVIDWSSICTGFIVAAISGYICIKLFLSLLDRYGVMPFVVYRIALGILLLYQFA